MITVAVCLLNGGTTRGAIGAISKVLIGSMASSGSSVCANIKSRCDNLRFSAAVEMLRHQFGGGNFQDALEQQQRSDGGALECPSKGLTLQSCSMTCSHRKSHQRAGLFLKFVTLARPINWRSLSKVI